jgi:hypothetical protein
MAQALRADERSQAIMRVPRDKTPGELILDDGQRDFVLFFVPQGEKLARVIEDASAFVPVAVTGVTRLVARAGIACITAHRVHAGITESELPEERQHAVVRLRGGTTVRGELRWVAAYGHRRTLDHLNDDSRHLVIHDGDYVHFVAKPAVLTVEEG